MLALAFAFAPTAYAVADIDFKAAGPVSIFVDGRQAAQQNPLRHKMSGLDAGVHELRVVGMFGKTLYEAEIDLPDNTITYASWERGEIKVLSTDWLPKEEAVAAAGPTDTGMDEAQPEEEQLVVVPPEPEAAAAAGGSESAAAPVAAAAGGAAVGAGVAVAASQEPEPEPLAEPAAPEPAPTAGGEDAVAAVEPTSAAGAAPEGAAGAAEGTSMAPAVVAGAAVGAGAVAATTGPPAAAPAAAPAPVAKPRTLTVQATEGMRIEVVKDAQKIVLIYENGVFRIEDGTGFSMVLGN